MVQARDCGHDPGPALLDPHPGPRGGEGLLCGVLLHQDLQREHDLLLVDEGDLLTVAIPLQEELKRFLHRPSVHVDKADQLVVHHVHGPGHQA